jgi:triacylglycerol lipase
MTLSDRQVTIVVIVAIVLTFAISFAIFYAYMQYMQRTFVEQFSQSSRTCSDIGTITYRQSVYIPQTNGVYEKNLATALLDIAINTTKANCSNVLPLPNPPNFNQQLRIEGIEPISRQQLMFAYIFWEREQQHAVISFTGTASKSVGQTNLQYQQVPPLLLNGYQDGVLCHEGFYSIYSSIRDQLWNWWNQNQTWVRTLYITGHSLGGALSTLCGFDFADTQVPELIHYSFAAPRVGNTGFVNTFMDRVPTSLRINNTEDPIPQLPPARIENWIYSQSGGNVPFTVTLDNLSQDHVEAYIDYLPTCPEVAECNSEE